MKKFDEIFQEANCPNSDERLPQKKPQTIDEIAFNFFNGCKYALDFERELNQLYEAKNLLSSEEIKKNYELQLENIQRLNQELVQKFAKGEDRWIDPDSKSKVIKMIGDIQDNINIVGSIKPTVNKTQLELDKFIRQLKSKDLISDNDLK